MSERVEFGTMPSKGELVEWQAWLRAYGIEPNCVVIPGWIEVDGRVIRYLAGHIVARPGRDEFETHAREVLAGSDVAPFPIVR